MPPRFNKNAFLVIETTNSLLFEEAVPEVDEGADENVKDTTTRNNDLFGTWCCGAASGGGVSPLFSIFLERVNIMGDGISKPSLTQEEADLKWLGERFPYGDNELRHIYQAYYRLLSSSSKQQQQQQQKRHFGGGGGRSFLQDWIMECSGTALAVESSTRNVVLDNREHELLLSLDQRRDLIQRVENEILGGNHVGNALFRVACTTADDTVWYSSVAPATPSPLPIDEFTRKARLERLFEGFSNMGRRGAKQALTTMFDTVKELQSQQQQQTSSQSQVAGIPAKALMNFGYRMSLAAGFFQAVQTMEKHLQQQQQHQKCSDADNNNNNNNNNTRPVVDVMARASQLFLKFIPCENCDADLEPMAQSLIEKRTSRQNRYSVGPAVNNSTDDETVAVPVELEDVLEWSESVAPLFATIVPTLLFHVLFWGRPHPPSKTEFEFPNHLPDDETTNDDENDDRHLQNNSSNHNNSDTTKSYPPPLVIEPSILDSSPLLFALACTSVSLMGPYFRLYTSAADGLSFNRILNALLGYSGPTLLLIQSTTGGVFGAFMSHAWKESKDFYGNSDCFLFQLRDSLAVYRPRGQNKNYMYCNSAARSKGYDQQAHGIGFGGTVHQPRLFIAENLMEDCYAASQDLTFESGNLLPKKELQYQQQQQRDPGAGSAPRQFFEIESMEIWGVGGSDIVLQALDQRRKAREMREEGIRRARKVDKAQFLDDFRSGAIDSKAFAYKQQIDGRADQDVKERHGQQYEYEK